jgi:hypothetical protein
MKFRNIKTGEISEPFFEGEYAYWNDICGIGSRQMLINEFNSLFEPINKLTCRGCNNELDNCTCNVLTTGKKLKLTTVNSLAIRELDRRLEAYANTCNLNQAHIKDLERINKSHRIENGELRERIKELEELMPTKDEATFGICSFHLYDSGVCMQNCPFYKKQINPMEHCKGWSLSRDFSIKERLTSKLQKVIGE